MTLAFRTLAAVSLALVGGGTTGGCRKDEAGGEPRPAPAAEPDAGLSGIDDPGQWPPPPLTPAHRLPPPPEVEKLMERMVGAFDGKDGARVGSFFVARMALDAAAKCSPAAGADRIDRAARDAAARAANEGGDVRFDGFGEGYLLELTEGDEALGCRAKRPIAMYLARFDWQIGGRKEAGEARFLRAGDVWFFTRLQ